MTHEFSTALEPMLGQPSHMKVSGFAFLRNGHKCDDRWIHLRGVTYKDNFGRRQTFFTPRRRRWGRRQSPANSRGNEVITLTGVPPEPGG